MGDPKSTSGDRPAQQSGVAKRVHKVPRTDDVVSTITEDSFISFRKDYHFPNDVVMKVPARSDRACSPPSGYVTVYEFSLRAGLRFPPAPELIDIARICGVSLSQFSYKALSIVMGLIVLFRDRKVVLSVECLSRIGRFYSDTQGRISFKSKWLDIRIKDPTRGWINSFFYVQNDWGLQEKWDKLQELPAPLHIGTDELLRILKLPDLDALHYEVRYLSRYIDEEFLFKVGLSTQAGRSHAQMLKKSSKAPESTPQKSRPRRSGGDDDMQTRKKKKTAEIPVVDNSGPQTSPSRSHIPENILNHQCVGRRRVGELQLEIEKILNDWNNEFVKVKYLQGEYKKKHDGKMREMKVLEDELEACRTEITNRIATASFQSDRIDRLHIQLVDAQATNNQLEKDQEILKAEVKNLQSLLAEKETQKPPSEVIEEFKKSYAFKIIIADHVQEARDHIFDVEVKASETKCTENGFIRGFMKGIRAVHRKTGAEIEGLTPSQASSDASAGSDGDELESEIQQAFSLIEEGDDDLEIL